MNDFNTEVRIPEERIAVLIGKTGAVKKDLETRFSVSLRIESNGDVHISSSDSLKVYIAEKVVKAIGRGFNPEIAKLLEKDNYDFDLFSLTDYARNDKDIERLKGRVIGRDGMCKGMIEKLTGGNIIIYGKTIGVIADADVIEIIRESIEMLLKGARHVTVFSYLEKENQRRKRELVMK